MTGYLTEAKLGEELKKIFPNNEFIHNKKFIDGRPDYRCEALKLIVEFDGYRHYNSSKVIYNDFLHDNMWDDAGYDVVRIPYFVQLSSQTIKLLFNIDIKYEQIYPHGFIDKKALLPADFCDWGFYKFNKELEIIFIDIRTEIIQSLFNIADELGEMYLVFPKSYIDNLDDEINDDEILNKNLYLN